MPTSSAKGRIAVAQCDRCALIFPYNQLIPDGQSPGLRVCRDCYDFVTPFSLPSQLSDPFILKHPRPIVKLIDWKYRNEPVYQGGPISYGEPDPNGYQSQFGVSDPNRYPNVRGSRTVAQQAPPEQNSAPEGDNTPVIHPWDYEE